MTGSRRAHEFGPRKSSVEMDELPVKKSRLQERSYKLFVRSKGIYGRITQQAPILFKYTYNVQTFD